MKEKWIVKRKGADYKSLSERYGVDPVIIRLMLNRGIDEAHMEEYLHPSISQLHDPHQLKDADKAAEMIAGFIAEGATIRIIGDYDIDGINSTYILYKCLQHAGADVDYAIPDRIVDGYGLNVHLVDAAHQAGREVIITCDNGIAAAKEIKYAKFLGMKVIITDHHEVPYTEEDGERVSILPPADCIVNPKQSDCPYPFSGICGAVVAWKLMFVLYEKMGLATDYVMQFIENAGFATVGDVMDLRDENRAIVRLGLDAMNNTANIGLKALIELLNINEIQAYHFGFVLGPTFNASGRLETAMLAMQLLTCEDANAARSMAQRLIDLNSERKALTEAGVRTAAEAVDGGELMNDRVLVVHLPEVHESIAGIIAGRLRERYNRPTFVITGTGDIVKGSGRSIETYSMYDEMTRIKDCFTQYGGHPMAAGFSLERDRIGEMRRRLNELCTLTEDDLMPRKYIDVPMPLPYITEELIGQLSLLEPMGKGNEKPVFAEKDALMTAARRIGKESNMLRITVSAGGRKFTAMYFSDADKFLEEFETKFGAGSADALLSGRGAYNLPFSYYPSINEFNGTRSIQVVINGVLW